jgi:hypothetical protein
MAFNDPEEKLLVINFAVPVPENDEEEAFSRIDDAWIVTRRQIMEMYRERDFDETGTAHKEWFGDSRLKPKEGEIDEYE